MFGVVWHRLQSDDGVALPAVKQVDLGLVDAFVHGQLLCLYSIGASWTPAYLEERLSRQSKSVIRLPHVDLS